ncbi:anhydro-N-acetylmuramic acid kinase [Deinococcus phoenicis]|uniref:Anhydro-N-acetylmuramic acid kinase n=1 Tax=Deinococcus phoenicis TaxID=1476583 RepID=A0A016QTI7_9DEIO|nr:anhydro-N-acetylmuramic acid kinase [Deinococcus phoenicis]EYB69192.1 anhydro-N-acetylmuramic acid kinase [Deinococcus phoenicis]
MTPRAVSPRILGLMSGTSADGIDAALLELPGWPALGSGGNFPALPGGVPRGRVVEHVFTPFSPDLRAAVLAAMREGATTADLTQLHWWLGEALAEAAAPLAASAHLIASHGQTVQHQPRPDPARGWARPATLQLGEAALIAERTGKPVVADFRPADVAAGGLGAPLVPFADWALFAQPGVRRAVHNLGGISNLTFLPGTDRSGVLAFDTGPGNCLLDEVAARAGQVCDEGGRLAAAGRAHAETLAAWLAQPELTAPPPKATGREVWTLERLPRPADLSVPDLAATATALTARTVADAYARWIVPRGLNEIVVAGGGARNPTLLAALRAALSPLPVLTFEEVGWAARGFTDATREAAAFAFLGYARAQGWANTLPHTTGARRAVSAGKLLFSPPLPENLL